MTLRLTAVSIAADEFDEVIHPLDHQGQIEALTLAFVSDHPTHAWRVKGEYFNPTRGSLRAVTPEGRVIG